jgi:hypothetical protein
MPLIPRALALGYSYDAPTALEPGELRGTPGELLATVELLLTSFGS